MKQHLQYLITSVAICIFCFSNINGQSFQPRTLHKVEPNVYVFNGGSGFFVNSLILDSKEGLILIDTQMEDENNELLIKLLKERFPEKPIESFIISHAHLDHFIGLSLFKEAFGEFEIVGIDGEKKHMVESTDILWPTYESLSEKSNLKKTDILYPTREVKRNYTIQFYDKTAQVEIVGANESWTSMIVYLPGTKTVFVGDMYWGDLIIEPEVGATVIGWSRELHNVLAKNVLSVIPGHAPVLFTRDDLQNFVDNIDKLVATGRQLIDNGMDKEAFVKYDFPVNISFFGDKESTLRNIYDELHSTNPVSQKGH